MTELKQISTWETLKRAAQIKCHDIQNYEVHEETGLPAISYHRKCYQFFTMKSILDTIKDALKKRQQFASFGTSNESDDRPKRGNSEQGTVLLPKDFIFCRKNKYKNIDEWASNSIIDAAKSSDSFYVKGLADQDVIAREAHYHTSCYKVFKKPQKFPSHNDPYKKTEQLAFKEVLRKCHKLNLKPKITYFTEPVRFMRDTMLSKNVIMDESARKFLERKLEKHCTSIKMFNYKRKVVVYPISLGIKQAIE